MMTQKKHIVLGSRGFIGKYLINFLRSQGKIVVEWDIKNSSAQDCRIADLHLSENDIVYFLAWDVGGSKYLPREDTQMQQIENNLCLMKNVFAQLEKAKSSFIFTSSQLAEHKGTYGTLKRLGEIWASQLGGCCVRLWNAYGSYEECSEKSHVITDFIYQAIENKRIILLSSGEEERQFIHVRDICEALQFVLSTRSTKVYDVSSFESIKIIDVAKMIAKNIGADVTPGSARGCVHPSSIVGRPPGWFPAISFNEGLRETIILFEEQIRNVH